MLKVLVAKSEFFRIINPAPLALGLVQDCISQLSGHQVDGCQVVQKMGTRSSGQFPGPG